MTSTFTNLRLGLPRYIDSSPTSMEKWRALIVGRGPQMVASMVEGDFANAAPLDAGTEFLAANWLAIHHLCYRTQGRKLRIAQRVDGFVSNDTDLHPKALIDHLYCHVIPSARTAFKDVRRVPQAHCLLHAAGRSQIIQYWLPKFHTPITARDETMGVQSPPKAAALPWRGRLRPCFVLDAGSRILRLCNGSRHDRLANAPLPARTHDYNFIRRLGCTEILSAESLRCVPGQRRWAAASRSSQGGARAKARSTSGSQLAQHLGRSQSSRSGEDYHLGGQVIGWTMLKQDPFDFLMSLPPTTNCAAISHCGFSRKPCDALYPKAS